MSPFTVFCKEQHTLWFRILLAAFLGQKEALPESEMLE